MQEEEETVGLIGKTTATNDSVSEEVLSSFPKDVEKEQRLSLLSLADDSRQQEGLISIEDAIELIGFGRFQIYLMIAAGLCFASDAMEVLLLSFLSIVLQAEWNLTHHEVAFLTGVVFLGAMVGSLVLGRLGDRIGRRPVYLTATSLIAVMGVATSLCQSYPMLVLARVVVGFGVGGSVVPFDIVAEMLPTSSRGKTLLSINYLWTFGTLLVPLLAYMTFGRNDNNNHENNNTNDDTSWRYFVALCSIPCVLSATFGHCLVPESPRWLCTVGREKEGMAIIRRGAVLNGKNPDKLFGKNAMLRPEEAEGNAHICDLFSPKWKWITINLWTVWAGFALLYYGNVIVSTNIFSSSKHQHQQQYDGTVEMASSANYTRIHDTSSPSSSSNYSFDYGAIFTSCSAELFGTTLVIWSVDKLGRIPSQVLSYVLGGISVCLMALCSSSDQGNNNNNMIVITLAFVARMFLMSGSCVTWVGTAELLTTEIRSTGHAASSAAAKLGGFLSPFLVQGTNSLQSIGLSMLAISAVVSAAACQLPETKGRAMGSHKHI